jgi:protein-L-isoaspartate(D-aspartate) O-methyltransferase
MTRSARASASEESKDEGRYHRREWAIQRVGWSAMLLFVLVAGLGFLGGSGPFTRATIGGPSELKISYERFLRYAAGSTVDVSIETAGSTSFTLEISDSYLQQFDLQSITPEPRSMHAAEGRIVMTFDAASTPANISLRLEPEHIGSHTGVFRLSSGAEASIKQFVYP